MPENALVLFSGGQDSTTCLAWALSRYDAVETVGFTYGQRHIVEMACREDVRAGLAAISPSWKDKLGRDHLVDLGVLAEVSVSALTADLPFDTRADGLPSTFVPGRNLVFLTFAAIVAHQRGLKSLVTGVCETDYSGYPDCRDDTMKALQVAINLGMEARLVIETPLMWIDKAATWKLAQQLGGEALIDLIVEKTHSCYQGDRSHRHAWGFGCGSCDACRLRGEGWRRYTRRLPFDGFEAEEGGISEMTEGTRFWLVRHAAVDGRHGTIWPPSAPADVGDRGSFDRLRARLPKEVKAYASPAQRTVDTANALQLDPLLMPEFAEQDFGEWTGRRHDDLAVAGGEAYAKFWNDPARSIPPGGESFVDQIIRVRRGLDQIETGAAILVVHSGTIRAALCGALDIEPEAALRFAIDPLSLTRIDRLDGGWRVMSVNQNFL